MNVLKLMMACLLLLFLPGCWDYHKINERAPIVGLGIDPVEGNSSLVHYTFQIPDITSEQKEGGGGNPSSGQVLKFKNFSIDAQDIHSAIFRIQTQYTRMFYLGNFGILVLNTHLTSAQVTDAVMELVRDPAANKLSYILCTNHSAKEILSNPVASMSPSDSLENGLSKFPTRGGYVVRTRLWHFWRDSFGLGIEPKVGIVNVINKLTVLAGAEAFKGYKPNLELSPEDTFYFNFLNDKVYHASLLISDGKHYFSVRQMKSTSRISVTMNPKNQFTLHGKIKVISELATDESKGQKNLTDNEIHRYEKLMSRYIQMNVEKVLQKLQSNKEDIYGFGEYWVRNHPDQKEFVQHQWSNAFAHAKLDIKVEVHIDHIGTLL
ncbi:Ger(x)C family spore germination protein [Alicyclobacillaceae bacterium I2511]|nr:Ger(x)C family spore germination protein [Alicyclobacillaceae bacterium I2511]